MQEISNFFLTFFPFLLRASPFLFLHNLDKVDLPFSFIIFGFTKFIRVFIVFNGVNLSNRDLISKIKD